MPGCLVPAYGLMDEREYTLLRWMDEHEYMLLRWMDEHEYMLLRWMHGRAVARYFIGWITET